jgi:putative intracellular protease/amidase
VPTPHLGRRQPKRSGSRAIRLGADAGTRVSIAPVSTAAAVEVIRRAKADGLAVTAEACPHADLCLVDLTARHCVDRAAVGINQPGRRPAVGPTPGDPNGAAGEHRRSRPEEIGGGALYEIAGLPFVSYAVIDGNLVTGQNPGSAKETATKVGDLLTSHRSDI